MGCLRKFRYLQVVAVLLASGIVAPQARAEDVAQWTRWEKTLTSSFDYASGGNPYRDVLLTVTYRRVGYTGPCNNDLNCYTGYGFWETGRTFKIRTAFPYGTWDWTTGCTMRVTPPGGQPNCADPAEIGLRATGQVNALPFSDPYSVSPLYINGFLKVYSTYRYLGHANDSKFFWEADTAWNAAITDRTSNTRWITFLDDRKQRGYTVVLLAPAPSGDDPTVATTILFEDIGSCSGNAWPKSCSRWRSAYWQNLDEKIRIANDKGLLVVLVGVMDPQGNVTGSPLYPSPMDAAIFARNLAARLSGSFVIFSPSFDDQLTATSDLMNWTGCSLRNAAPRHLVTAHLAGSSTIDKYQDVHNRRWHQLHVFQSGHAGNPAGCFANEDSYECAMRRARRIPEDLYNMTRTVTPPQCPNTDITISLPLPTSLKPNVNGEGPYDHTFTEAATQTVNSPYGVRHAGYYSTLSGAFGMSLGVLGVWDWTTITTARLNSNGSKQIAILGGLFNVQPWQNLVSRTSTWISQQYTNTEEDRQVTMAATPDNNFGMLYLPDNDFAQANLAAFTINGFSCSGSTWTRTWVNPKTGLPQAGWNGCELLSGSTFKFSRPQCTGIGSKGDCDWVLKLRRSGTGPALPEGLVASAEVQVDEEWTEDAGWVIVASTRGAKHSLGLPAPLGDASQPARIVKLPAIASETGDSRLVVWEEENGDGYMHGIVGQRVLRDGSPQGKPFVINATAYEHQTNPWVASSTSGRDVVVWTSWGQDGDRGGVFARLIGHSGRPQGGEIPVNEFWSGRQDFAKVGMDAAGNFVVAWTSEVQDGEGAGVYARRFDSSGLPLGSEFLVNNTTKGDQWLSSLEVAPSGDFSIIWASYTSEGRDLGVFGRSFDVHGVPFGDEGKLVAPTER